MCLKTTCNEMTNDLQQHSECPTFNKHGSISLYFEIYFLEILWKKYILLSIDPFHKNIILVPDFCPLKTEIARFPIGFCLNPFSTFRKTTSCESVHSNFVRHFNAREPLLRHLPQKKFVTKYVIFYRFRVQLSQRLKHVLIYSWRFFPLQRPHSLASSWSHDI